MSTLTDTATYTAAITQYDATTPATGGPGGPMNAPLQDLANRTAYLKVQTDALNSASSGLAPLLSPALTGSPTAPTQASGDNSTKIATDAFVQAALGGVLNLSVAGGATVTLTAAQAGNGILNFSGALTANIAVVVPTSPTRSWIVENNTSGAYTLTVKTAAGTGVAVAQGGAQIVFTDGTNVLDAETAKLALTGGTLSGQLTLPGGGTGSQAITASEAAALLAASFGGSNQSLSANGYQKLPGGLILQWGSVTQSSGTASVTFPLAFPSACKSVTTSMVQPSIGNDYAVTVSTPTTTGFSVYSNVSYNAVVPWIAIGY